MKIDVTYLLCPDKTCRLFFKEGVTLPCERHCPHQTKLKKIILCASCQEIIELPGDHSAIQRVDHHCPGGHIAGNLQRLSGKYHRIFQKPKK
ncbi:MAG: hypothetical protein Q7K65_04850 [Candidatus Buchananbacteria bacterium]|nr:hypothetical protein [Candidatus Buchananbacteria bacterium]